MLTNWPSGENGVGGTLDALGHCAADDGGTRGAEGLGFGRSHGWQQIRLGQTYRG